jgi:hypothetical protein
MNASRHGDDVPLLRLGADVDPGNGFGTDLREFSAGHGLARGCVDGVLPFDKSAGPVTRATQFARAYAREPDFYGPISKPAWAHPGYLGFQPSPCIVSRWEDRPMYRAGARVKGVPTLVLGGEYDLPVPEAVSKLATKVMVDSTYVGLRAAGHDPEFSSSCGPELVQRFIDTLAAGDTSCADRPAMGWWVPGSFPTSVEDAPAATQRDGKPATKQERQLATVAAWTVMDTVQHNFFISGDSVPLRGGTLAFAFDPIENADRWRLGDAHFTEDVAVSGTFSAIGRDFDGEFSVTGPGARTQTMRIAGPFLTDRADMTITSDIGGQPATFTVPAY